MSGPITDSVTNALKHSNFPHLFKMAVCCDRHSTMRWKECALSGHVLVFSCLSLLLCVYQHPVKCKSTSVTPVINLMCVNTQAATCFEGICCHGNAPVNASQVFSSENVVNVPLMTTLHNCANCDCVASRK